MCNAALRLGSALLLAVAPYAALCAEPPPKVMTRIEVFLEGPDIPAGSFATKPKVMYRAGSQYCRIEEAPDPDNGIHGLLIINEPDAWMVNLLKKTAQHTVDHGPTFNCRLPIFPETERALEFGLEPEYFKAKGAIPQQGPVLQSKSTTIYRVDVAAAALALITYEAPDGERPMAVARTSGGKGEIFWYRGWGDVPFDPTLFAKPAGVTIQDQKQ
jgi:hypothetical protein